MQNIEPDEANAQDGTEPISIHINSPDNRIAGRDYIEVNIQIENKPKRGRGTKSDGKMTSSGQHSIAIRHAVTEAINVLFPEMQNERIGLNPSIRAGSQ